MKLRPYRVIDLTGMRFGKLLVKSQAVRVGRKTRWLCKCDCGKETIVQSNHLRAGATKSCGCSQYRIKHNKCESREYNSWGTMIQRCTNPKNTNYKNYGARGITVCKRWMDFEKFYKDMGDRPIGCTLERKNNNLGYSPSNCIWADRHVQNRNTRLRSTNKTGHKGVSWSKERGKYVAQIVCGGKTIPLGRHVNIEDAIAARRRAEQRYWGRK